MAINKLEKTEWPAYFDTVTKSLIGKSAEIEVQSLALGNQIEAEWLPLLGITYEARSDMLEIVLDGLDHMIRKPAEVYVDGDANRLTSMEVVDADQVRQIVRLREPLMLPPPR